MEQKDIVRGVAIYILRNRKSLIGRLGGKEVFSAFPAADFGGRLESQPVKVKGYAIDVLADMIKKDKFLPDWVGDEPIDVLSPHAGRIEPLPTVNHSEEGSYNENGVTRIPQFQYMNQLRVCASFLGYVNGTGLERTLKSIKDIDLDGKWMKEEIAYLFHTPLRKN